MKLELKDAMDQLKFDSAGLIPAILQDRATGRVLMQAYMNREALDRTLQTGRAWFYSRSRGQLWQKGETSGHFQEVSQILYDCDADCLLLQVRPQGPACHTGEASCFYRTLAGEEAPCGLGQVLADLHAIIASRAADLPEGSYTAKLLTGGLDRLLKKIGEEATEVVLGAKNNDQSEVIYESADLLYHLMVLLYRMGIEPERVAEELGRRFPKSG